MPLETGHDAAGAGRRRGAPADVEEAFEIATSGEGLRTASRRDLLPDIEEINSTLRARPPHGAEMAEEDTAPPSPEVLRRRGVRIGFFSTLALVALVAWVYSNSTFIAGHVPQAAPALDGLTARIDVARLWLDDLARGLAGEDEAGS
jgi:hypothetical protein